MANANLQLDVKGTDKTGAAFKSVEWRAKAAAAKLRSMLGGALAAAGAYLSFRAIKSGIDELGKLSDIAQKTSTNVGELTQASTALSILGVNGDIDALAKAFSLMEKNTGRSGLQGFYETIDEIGKIPDLAERGKAAMAAFGRSGLEFMPLINAAHDGTDALRGVVAAMPAIPQSAADAGDAVADAMSIAAQGTKSIWLQAVGAVAGWFDEHFTGGVREAAAQAVNWLEYYAKLSVSKLEQWGGKAKTVFTSAFAGWKEFFTGEGSLSERWANMQSAGIDEWQAHDDFVAEEQTRIDAWRKTAEERAKAIKEAFSKAGGNYDKAAISAKSRINIDAGNESAASRAQRITNQLVMGGSNASMRLAITGPQLQSEQRRTNEKLDKTNQLLGKIADAQNKTADGEDYGTIN